MSTKVSASGTVHAGVAAAGHIGGTTGVRDAIARILHNLNYTRPTLWSIESVVGMSGGIGFVVGGGFSVTLKWHGPCPSSEDPSYFSGLYKFNFTILGVGKGIPVSFAVSTPSMPTYGSRICFAPFEGGYLLKDEIVGNAAIIYAGAATPLFGLSTAMLLIPAHNGHGTRAWGCFNGVEAGVDLGMSVATGVMDFVEEVPGIPPWSDK